MEQRRVRINQEPVIRRELPINHLQVAATTSGTADTLLTVNDGVHLKIKQLAVCNTSASAVTLSLNSIPSGGSIGDDNAEMRDVSIPANTTADLDPYIGQFYEGGTVIKAYAGTTNVLVLHGWAEEIQ